MKIYKDIYLQVLDTIGKAPIESGGILGKINKIVCKFYFDKDNTQKQKYQPNTKAVNKILSDWCEQGIEFFGIVHSHPNGIYAVSKGDIGYAREILRLNELEYIYFIILFLNNQGTFNLNAYRISPNNVRKERIIIIEKQ